LGPQPTASAPARRHASECRGGAGKYWWKYDVTNNTFDPVPGTSNGFSGFELALPVSVPDIGDISAPDPAWDVDCCSGLPVEWDKDN